MSGTFASPSLQNLTSPLKERIVGQKELANLIEKVKISIIARVDQYQLNVQHSDSKAERSCHDLGVICEPSGERSQNSTEFISFAD